MAEYEPPRNDVVDFTIESYELPRNDAVDFTIGEPQPSPEEPSGPFRLGSDPLSLPLSLDLPLQPLNLRRMETGLSVFLVGMFAVIGGGAYLLGNYIALALLGLGVVSVLMSGTIGIGLEMFWAIMIATVLVLIVGALWRAF